MGNDQKKCKLLLKDAQNSFNNKILAGSDPDHDPIMSYIEAFKWIYSRLQRSRRKQFWILFIGMTSAALMETVALGAVAFLLQPSQTRKLC